MEKPNLLVSGDYDSDTGSEEAGAEELAAQTRSEVAADKAKPDTESPKIILPSAASLLSGDFSASSVPSFPTKRPTVAGGVAGQVQNPAPKKQPKAGESYSQPKAAGIMFRPPQLSGRTNVVTEDLEKIGMVKKGKKAQGAV
eukprot:jgi/Mesvir1/5994/Mv00743-RA.1